MGFILFVIVILVVLFFYIDYLLCKYGENMFVYILLIAIIFGFVLWEHTDYAGESYPYSEIHLADSKGNVYEIILIKDGQEVDRIKVDNSVPK